MKNSEEKPPIIFITQILQSKVMVPIKIHKKNSRIV
jgi:hypothetical protein